MSEIINLIKENPDSHIYSKAVGLLSDRLQGDYSFVFQVWDKEMPKKTKHPRILIQTSDEGHCIPIQSKDPEYLHIFKQYAPMKDIFDRMSTVYLDKVSPLPLGHLRGFVNKNIPISERKYEWSWMGQFDPYARTNFKTAITKLEHERPNYRNHVLWYSGWNNGAPLSEYCDIMNNTKIALVPAGSRSLESFRFFEAMYAGCAVISVGMPDIAMYNTSQKIFMDPNWRSLNGAVDYLISREEETVYFSKVARIWYDHFCSPEGVADYMFKELQKRGIE